MKNAVPIAIIVAGIILAGAVYMSTKSATTLTRVTSPGPEKVRGVGASDHILGSPTATIKIIEYSDFDCVHCKSFNDTLHQIINNYGAGGSVAWVFRNFPLIELNPNAKKHAEAAECVALTAGSEAYVKFSDLLFENQPADPTKYAEYALASGASPDAVASCIQNAASNGITARVDADRQDAIDAGASGTPYSLILVDGSPPITIESAWPYVVLKNRIDTALKGAR